MIGRIGNQTYSKLTALLYTQDIEASVAVHWGVACAISEFVSTQPGTPESHINKIINELNELAILDRSSTRHKVTKLLGKDLLGEKSYPVSMEHYLGLTNLMPGSELNAINRHIESFRTARNNTGLFINNLEDRVCHSS